MLWPISSHTFLAVRPNKLNSQFIVTTSSNLHEGRRSLFINYSLLIFGCQCINCQLDDCSHFLTLPPNNFQETLKFMCQIHQFQRILVAISQEFFWFPWKQPQTISSKFIICLKKWMREVTNCEFSLCGLRTVYHKMKRIFSSGSSTIKFWLLLAMVIVINWEQEKIVPVIHTELKNLIFVSGTIYYMCN